VAIRSYESYEYLPESKQLRNTKYFDEEVRIAKKIVRTIPLRDDNPRTCIGCGRNEIELFFTKWDVEYFRCQKCGTVFANTDEDTVRKFSRDTELKELRTCEDYQNSIAEKRSVSWSELIDWISYRSFRYLGKNKNLKITDVGNRYTKLADMIKTSGLCSEYELTDSIWSDKKLDETDDGHADVILCFDRIQNSTDPLSDIKKLNTKLKEGGLLYLGLKIGSGFEMLVLKEHADVFPYEHIFLPSVGSLEQIMEKAKFEILDESTPGKMDVASVLEKKDHIDQSELFIRKFIETADPRLLNEFQHFLQKSGMSSYARIVARKASR